MLCFPFGCQSFWTQRTLSKPLRGDAGSWRITKTLSSFPARHGPCGKQEACNAEKSQSDLQAQLRDASSKRASAPSACAETLLWLGMALRSKSKLHVANPASSAPCPLLPSHLLSHLLQFICNHAPAAQHLVCSTKWQISSLPRGLSACSSLHVECFSLWSFPQTGHCWSLSKVVHTRNLSSPDPPLPSVSYLHLLSYISFVCCFLPSPFSLQNASSMGTKILTNLLMHGSLLTPATTYRKVREGSYLLWEQSRKKSCIIFGRSWVWSSSEICGWKCPGDSWRCLARPRGEFEPGIYISKSFS